DATAAPTGDEPRLDERCQERPGEDREALLRGERERRAARFPRDQRAGRNGDGKEDEPPDGEVPADAVDQVERGEAGGELSGLLRFELLLARQVEEREREGEGKGGRARRGRADVHRERGRVGERGGDGARTG